MPSDTTETEVEHLRRLLAEAKAENAGLHERLRQKIDAFTLGRLRELKAQRDTALATIEDVRAVTRRWRKTADKKMAAFSFDDNAKTRAAAAAGDACHFAAQIEAALGDPPDEDTHG